MKKILLILGIVLILATVTVVGKNFIDNIRQPIAIINDRSFRLYVAKTPKEKKIGLSKYESLPDNYAMLFPFEKAEIHSFWMKDMKFPIDIIFIKDNTVVTIHRNVPSIAAENTILPIYTPSSPANMVLEINAGLSEKYNLQEGDIIVIKNLKDL